jgi:hypothetical protein
MLSDTSTPSHLYTSPSCFKDNDHTEDSTGENMMTQPLVMSNETLENEEQTKLQKERQSRTILCKSFLLGSSISFALQVMSCAACYTLVKMFGKDPKPSNTPASLLGSLSYCMLVLISQLDITIYVTIWLTFMYTITKSGSLYMRKKFDTDAENPKSEMVFIGGVYFLFGTMFGSFSLWIIVDLRIGMVIPLTQVLILMMLDLVAFLLMVKCFDFSHAINASGHTAEQELEDDSWWCFVV